MCTYFDLPATISRPDQSRALQRGLVFPRKARHPCHVQQAQRDHRGVWAAGADAGALALRAAHESLPHDLVLLASPRHRWDAFLPPLVTAPATDVFVWFTTDAFEWYTEVCIKRKYVLLVLPRTWVFCCINSWFYCYYVVLVRIHILFRFVLLFLYSYNLVDTFVVLFFVHFASFFC